MVIVVTTDDAWWAPLAALFEVRGVRARRVHDAVDAIGEVKRGGVLSVVFDAAEAPDEVLLAARALARRDAELPAVWVGEATEETTALFSSTIPERFGYVAIVDAVDDSSTPDTPAPATDVEPLDEAGLQRLLRLARDEDYFVLLDARRSSDTRTLEALAGRLLARLARLPEATARQRPDEVAELREAIEDARGVLTSPRARALYLGEEGD